MGPPQKGYDVKINTAPGMRFDRRRQTGRDFFLPVTRRGSFFEDSSFSNIHHHFDAALRDVLDKWYDDDDDDDMGIGRWNDRTSRRSDVFDRYRRLRSRDMKEENQAVTVTSDDTCHKFVLDVHDFLNGDIKVQVVDEENLVIEGRTSTHSFKKSFSLPYQTDVDNIVSVISLEGILTVTVPKMGCEPLQKPTTIPVTVEETKKASEAQTSSTSSASFSKNISQEQTSTNEENECSRHSQGMCEEKGIQEDFGEYEIPIVKEEKQSVNFEQFEESQKSEMKEKTTEDKETTVPIIMEEIEQKNDSCAQTENTIENQQASSSSFMLKSEEQNTYDNSGSSSIRCSPCPEKMYASAAEGDEEHYSIPVQIEKSRLTPDVDRSDRDRTPNRSSMGRHSNYEESDEDTESHKAKSEKKRVAFCEDEDEEYEYEPFEPPTYPKGSQYLPIVRKFGFNEDYFFEGVRQNYAQAVKDVLEMARQWTGKENAMRDYRNLRDKDLKLENQAFCVTDDQHWYKVVIDVQDFTGGDITVQLVDGKELVVEGYAEKQDATRLQRLSFVRKFALPDLADREAIVAALSSDGVLIIVAPKRVLRRKKRESSCDRRGSPDDRNWREKYGLDRFEESESNYYDKRPSLQSFLNQF